MHTPQKVKSTRVVNPLTDKHILVGVTPKQPCILHRLSMLRLVHKTIWRAARWLIALRPKQNIKSQSKWPTCLQVALQNDVRQ